MANLGTGNMYFLQLNLKAAYHQVPLSVASRSLTTIITNIGTYKFTMIPFGIKSAPSAFQRRMSELIEVVWNASIPRGHISSVSGQGNAT